MAAARAAPAREAETGIPRLIPWALLARRDCIESNVRWLETLDVNRRSIIGNSPVTFVIDGRPLTNT